MQIIRTITKIVFTTIVSINLIACATPTSQEIALNEKELKQEMLAQHELTRKYPPKKITAPKHHAAYYQNRLQRVGKPLIKSVAKMCKTGQCSYNFKLNNKRQLNAWADGSTVHITPIMMDFLETDAELAMVLSHELAHNSMNHVGKNIQNSVIGAIFDVAAAVGGLNTGGLFTKIGSSAHSQGFENEADYIGLYIMHNAGYDITNAHQLWRKMSIQTPRNIGASFFASHPSNAERYLRMRKAIAEIKAKPAAKVKRPNPKVVTES